MEQAWDHEETQRTHPPARCRLRGGCPDRPRSDNKALPVPVRAGPTHEEAEAVRDRLIAAVTAGREPKTKAKFGELLDKMLEVADLDFTTRGMYQGYIERTIRPVFGEMEVSEIEQRPDLLDSLYASLRRCKKLCGGRRGLVDTDPPGVASGARRHPGPL